MVQAIIVAVITGVVTPTLVAVWQRWSARPDRVAKFYEFVNADNARLRARNDELEEDIRVLRRENDTLRRQVDGFLRRFGG